MDVKDGKKTNKKTKRPLVIVGCVIAVTAIVFSLVTLYGQYTSVSKGDESNEVSLLFVQTSHSGSLSAPDSDNVRTLILTDVSPRTVYFSDRPDRETGHYSIKEFIGEWSEGENSFAINPPNAVLDIVAEDSQSVIVLELMNPIYDEGAKTLQYDVIVLEEEGTDISEHGEELDLLVPQSFDEAALFIDSIFDTHHMDVVCSCNPGEGKDSCSCKFHHNLGKGSTMEYRPQCRGKYTWHNGKVTDLWPVLDITGQKRGTDCSGDWQYTGHAAYRVCVNNNIWNTDGLDLTVHCASRYYYCNHLRDPYEC